MVLIYTPRSNLATKMPHFFQQTLPINNCPPLSEMNEQQKLEQLQKIHQQTQDRLSHTIELHPLISSQSKPNIHIEISYQVLMSASIVKHSFSSYLFGKNLFNLIPGLSQKMLIGASLLYTLFDAILFLGFEVSLLKQSLNIKPLHPTPLQNLLLQIQILSTLHLNLSSIQLLQSFSKPEYEELYTITSLYSEDIKKQFLVLNQTPQEIKLKIASYLIILIGGISKIAGSYFLAESLLKTFYPLLLGTAWAWVVIGLMVSTSLAFYLLVSSQSIQNFIQPNHKYIQEIKSNYLQFEQTYQHLNHNHIATQFFFDKNNTEISQNIAGNALN
jgi:hypothetical protein